MTTSKLNFKSIKKRITVDVDVPSSVILELSLEEAFTLVEILYSIAGEPLSSARRYADSIGKALYKIGIVMDIEQNGTSISDGRIDMKDGSDMLIKQIVWNKINKTGIEGF